MSEYHTPVLLEESVAALVISADGTYADATFGGGGHSAAIMDRLSTKGRLVAFDRDPDAERNCPAALLNDPRFTLVHDNFRFILNYVEWFLRRCGDGCAEGKARGIDGILADLGVSSHQFDTPQRGFSFRFDAPLDMRMDSEGQSTTAADIVNSYSEEDLASLLDLYGEVPGAGRMAGLIVKARQKGRLDTTAQFNAAIAPALPKFAEHKMLAKVYQALRIEVNGEMRSLEKFLLGAADALLPGGRLVVITYQSLEDRMVKNFIRTGNVSGESGRDLYGIVAGPLKAVNRKPVLPSESEIAANTRARSAKLRIAEKIGGAPQAASR